MAPTSNKTWVFSKIPDSYPVPGEHITVQDRPIDLSAPPANGVIVEILSASMDPYLRGRMRDPSIKSYMPAFELNAPIVNGTVSRVLKSDNKDFAEGDLLFANLPVAQYARVDEATLAKAQKIQNPYGLDIELFLGPLGMPGLTAYSALHKIGKPKAGETIFVSSAAGAVGQVVGTIAKREGLKVIGSVGSDEKLKFITEELGFDAGFNYKKESVFDALPRLAPDGIDINWENVGGEHLEAALANMNKGGRVPLCGMIESYNTPRDQQRGIRGLMQLIGKAITMQGFLVGMPEFGPAYAKEHQEKVQAWLADGSFKAKLHVVEGIDKASEAFVEMLKGGNLGKAVLKIKSA
ncbi:hypothetical protein S7711_01945 [Stachybotrys chartarum IBT 7711]|uniref:Dehydrogenase FUB6 n=1 Tax=Stachybotrys chartarum (strain CBS 109288 / IBT 7711) TaxID=1280523 RepID=A0A084AMX3_STACB|nr:hypothetical protein S7711_01945 [Stachybotrys chartarum IBT 7711]KFA48790.1 hypothetical protein S40293_01534 [Stachybotrys chartarum IBT 40293]KFA78810.1 hypothetical protein S40288_05501 [Stachybotrys chartarum IBT 40288]